MSLSEIRSTIRYLKRVLARPRAQFILSRMADDLAQEWFRAETDCEPLPHPHSFVLKVVKAGSRLPAFTEVMRLPKARTSRDPSSISPRVCGTTDTPAPSLA